jgi:hypothetical protein
MDSKKLEVARQVVGENAKTLCVDVTDLKAIETLSANS